MSPLPQVGFIGLGNMGGPIAGWIKAGGFPIVVHDVHRAAADAVIGAGARWADSPGALAAGCDVVCTCVPGPAEMRAVFEKADGLLPAARDGQIFIDHTTNSPHTVGEIGSALEARGAHLLDAPLDGGREGAIDGALNLFVGGDAEILERVRPILDTFAENVVWTGELGTGSVVKVVHNALAMSIDLLVAECLTLGTKAGVGLPNLIDAFARGCVIGDNMTFTKRMPATLFRGDFEARFALKLAAKDFGLASDLAAEHAVPTRLLDICRGELEAAMARGWGDDDRLRASTLQEERAGVKLRLPK